MVLIIEDEQAIAYSLKIAFERIGVNTVIAGNGRDGLNFLKNNPSVVILDIKLPDSDGVTILKTIKEKKPLTPVIMITYLTGVRLAVNAMKIGAYDYFTKPFSVEEVVETTAKAIKYITIKEQLDGRANTSEMPVIGKSKAMCHVVDMIAKLAKASSYVTFLLQGESGVGKEVVARYFHYLKYNSMDKFIAINCAAIPATLLESELFGYEKGAFSEAKAQKIGLIEKANGGTLLLDEIGDMSLELQAKILRAIEGKSFIRIGGLKEITFSANIISATNKNLETEISKGCFRADLYYRLSVVKIQIPALVKRLEEIEVFLNGFLDEYNHKLGKNIKGYSAEALDILRKYHWPGNVRQLRNCVERAVILLDSDCIGVEDLPQELIEDVVHSDVTEYSRLDHAEVKMIMRVLSENHWNITNSALALGISRLTLRRKMQKYSLSEANFGNTEIQ